MYRLFMLFSFSLICLGCNTDELDSIEIVVPDDIELDLDQDGIPDFKVVYSQQTSGDPVGNYEEVSMKLESSGIDQILKNEDEFPIFLNSIDIIETKVESPLLWEITNPSANISFPMARIRTDYDEITWNDEWRIFSLEEKETYLIGFKLLGNNTPQLGFIEFLIDAQTGKFTLLKTEFL